jgi:uncharacterized protein (TIGR02246 family)
MSKDVEARTRGLVEAWNLKGPAKFGTFFTEDAHFTDVTGQLMEGRDGIERGHVPPWSTILREATLTADSIGVRQLRPDVAVVDLRWTTAGHKTPDGKPLPPRKGMMHVVMIQHDGTWLVASSCNADYTAAYKRGDAGEGAGPPPS